MRQIASEVVEGPNGSVVLICFEGPPCNPHFEVRVRRGTVLRTFVAGPWSVTAAEEALAEARAYAKALVGA